MKKIQLFILLCCLLFFAKSSLLAEAKFPPPKIYKVNYAIDTAWGKLVSVFDQPNSQRLTFENESQVTIIQVGLIWDSFSKTFEPTITQIIELKKGGPGGISSSQELPNIKMKVLETH